MPLLVPPRNHAPELMDAPGLPESEVAEAHAVLRRVNRWFFGANAPLRAEIQRWIAETQTQPRTNPLAILDLGSGTADLPRLALETLARLQRPATAVALDQDPVPLKQIASTSTSPSPSPPRIQPLRADALRLPFPDRSFDLVLAVKFAHHFDDPGLERLLAEMTRVARSRVLVLDIRRHRLAHLGFTLWSRIFTKNRLVRHDGPLSVLRAFTPDELRALPRTLPPSSRPREWAWTLRRHPGFQLALVGTRTPPEIEIGIEIETKTKNKNESSRDQP